MGELIAKVLGEQVLNFSSRYDGDLVVDFNWSVRGVGVHIRTVYFLERLCVLCGLSATGVDVKA